MTINRGLVFWGVALITAGAVALAIQSGAITSDITREAWRLWPVVLIVIGLSIIAARTPFALVATIIAGLAVGGLGGSLVGGIPDGMSIGCGGEPDQVATHDGSFAGDRAEVDLDFDCGDLTVTTAPGRDWSLQAGYGGRDEPIVTTDESSLRVEAPDGGGFIGFTDDRQDWDVVLPTDVAIELSVDANAASSDLDLTDADLPQLSIDANAGSVDMQLGGAEIGELTIDANAGSVDITADDATRLAGSVEFNAGSIDLCVPDGAVVAITLTDDNITFSHNLDESGLTRSGDTWRSGEGDPDITLSVDGNAASFTYNPEEGCDA
ncbi:MAG: LiaI-LiaF-like domain-containing protein [Candidatus Limnocylindria bacterium]